MTITDVRIPGQRSAGHDETVTSESQDLSQLRAMLDDPDYAGFRTEIREAIRRLTATSVLGA